MEWTVDCVRDRGLPLPGAITGQQYEGNPTHAPLRSGVDWSTSREPGSGLRLLAVCARPSIGTAVRGQGGAMRTTVDTGQAAAIPRGARACYATHLRHRSRHARTAVLLAAVIAAIAACTSSRAHEVARPANSSARVVATRTVGHRMRDLTIDSPALGRTAMVRLLLPDHFTAQPTRRWPVLWLLHGGADTYQAWTRSTDVEQQAALAAVLVVMPEGGPAGARTGTTLAARGRRAGRPST